MRLGALGASITAWAGAVLSSLCCLLPFAVILQGARQRCVHATMQCRWLLIPPGVLGVATGFALYIRERRRCAALACRMAGSRLTLALLIAAAAVVTSAILLDRFPDLTSELLARVMTTRDAHSGHDIGRLR